MGAIYSVPIIFDSEINEIQVKPVDVGEKCPDITSQRKLGSIRCHITGRTDIMIIGMDTLIHLAINHSATATFPVIQGEIFFVFSDNVQGRDRSDTPAQWATSGSAWFSGQDGATLETDWTIHFANLV